MSDLLRVALIGYGYAGQTFHAPLLASTPGIELAVIASSNPDKVHAHFPHVRISAQPQDALNDPSIDLVVVATPNTSHVPLTRAALEAGKHVVCDKPFTITTAEARSLAALAKAKDRLLSVFHNRRWDADFLTLRKLIAENTLGTIHSFESHFDRFRPEVRDRWREQPGPGSGLWWDLGAHLADQALTLFGLPESVQAIIFGQRQGARTDDYSHVVFLYPHGLQVILHISMLSPGGWPRFLVHGDKASWRKTGLDQQEPQLIAGLRPGAPDWGVDPVAGTLYTPDPDPSAPFTAEPPGERPVENLRGSYENYYAGIRNAVLNAAPSPVLIEEAIQVMAVLELGQESARTGKRLPFPFA